MVDVNWLAVIVAALSAVALGGIWYGPLSRRAWCRENGMDQDAPPQRHAALVFGIAFALSFLAAAVFAIFLGPKPTLTQSLPSSFAVGLCWVASSFGINYAFAGRSVKLWMIDSGYHFLQFTLYAVILGLWH